MKIMGQSLEGFYPLHNPVQTWSTPGRRVDAQSRLLATRRIGWVVGYDSTPDSWEGSTNCLLIEYPEGDQATFCSSEVENFVQEPFFWQAPDDTLVVQYGQATGPTLAEVREAQREHRLLHGSRR